MSTKKTLCIAIALIVAVMFTACEPVELGPTAVAVYEYSMTYGETSASLKYSFYNDGTAITIISESGKSSLFSGEPVVSLKITQKYTYVSDLSTNGDVTLTPVGKAEYGVLPKEYEEFFLALVKDSPAPAAEVVVISDNGQKLLVKENIVLIKK